MVPPPPPAPIDSNSLARVEVLRNQTPAPGFAHVQIYNRYTACNESGPCEFGYHMICLNDQPVSRIGTEGLIFAVVPTFQTLNLTQNRTASSPFNFTGVCGGRAILAPHLYNGDTTYIGANIGDSDRYTWALGAGATRVGILQKQPTAPKRVLTGFYLHPSYNEMNTGRPPERSENINSNDVEGLKKLCRELGFSYGSQKFGECVLTLIESR